MKHGLIILLANMPIACLAGFLFWMGANVMPELPVLAWVMVSVGCVMALFGMYTCTDTRKG